MVYEVERTDSPEHSEHSERSEPSRPQEQPLAVHLIPTDEREQLALRLQQSLTGFVDGPQHAVAEAAAVLDETAKQITAALTEQRHSLRAEWQGAGKDSSAEADTEELRVALRAYREVTERLLRL
ncbi:hypothetical protein [Streptomyces sp. NPDC001820]|uniref:hypothetical protein n=1 Tax=Streptomyces sp. NPDC001820 TaxID=3364613 RepID=UPI0036A4695E